MTAMLPSIVEKRRLDTPFVTPQAIARDNGAFLMSSRDLGTLCRVAAATWEITGEFDPPGVVWAAVKTTEAWRLTIGKGLNDDRYVYRFAPGEGFTKLFACPEFTGSYLSFDGRACYLSQWYKGEIHEVDDAGRIARTINVDAEICGHAFVRGALYVLRGIENKNVPGASEEWKIARVDLRSGDVEDLARVPFECRSLTHDGEMFWSNHRAANQTVAFVL